MYFKAQAHPLHSRGFSLIEALTAIMLIGILIGGFVAYSGAQKSVAERKIVQDVSTLNRAIQIYLASGGEIPADTSTADVLRLLKSSTSNERARQVVGLSGQMIDSRLGFVMESVDDAGLGRTKAIWDEQKLRFATTDDTDVIGIREFVIAEELAAEESQDETRATNLEYAATSSWVWDFGEFDDQSPPSGPLVRPGTGTPPAGGFGPPPETPELLALLPPEFSHAAGNYDYSEFSLPVVLTAPSNIPNTFEIYYSVDGSPLAIFDGNPLNVGPGSVITAYASSIDPDRWTDSSSVASSYDVNPVQLLDPVVSPAYPYFDHGAHPNFQVVISDSNDSGLPRKVEYRIEGGAWEPYVAPFTISVADLPSGAAIEARVVGNESWVLDSGVADALVKVKLQAPVIAAEVVEEVEATVTLTNPNPTGVSNVFYEFAPRNTLVFGAEQSYTGPLEFYGDDYPAGVALVARARSTSSRFLDSDDSQTDFVLVDPDNWVLAGSASAMFGNPSGGQNMVVSYADNNSSFSWGTGAWGTPPSQSSFDGQDFSNVRRGDIFSVGEISYFNGTINGGTGATGVDMTITINFGTNGATNFTFPLELVNRPNNSGTQAGDSDFLRIDYGNDAPTVRVYGRDYRVIIGFGQTSEFGFASVTEFNVFESEWATAELFATIVSEDQADQILQFLQGG